jgi:hypothetical protein
MFHVERAISLSLKTKKPLTRSGFLLSDRVD